MIQTSTKGKIVRIISRMNRDLAVKTAIKLLGLDDWDESKHPRGQPGNAGQFAPKGGGTNGSSKSDEIEQLNKQITGLSRFGEQGKKRRELQKKLDELTGEEKQEEKKEKRVSPAPQANKIAPKDPEYPVTPEKEAQFEIIQKTNPMRDDHHVGIRKPSDIRTAEEALGSTQEDDGYAYPDFTREDGKKALESGEITLYSSYPIEDGVFVTPSKMMAGDYAGGGKVYSKTVPVGDVAWINADEGQFARTSGTQGSGYSDAVLEAASKSRDYVDFWMNLPEEEQKKIKGTEELKKIYEEAKKTGEAENAGQEPEWKPANGTRADMPTKCKVPDKPPEIKITNDPSDTATAHAGESGVIEVNLANFDPENVDSVIGHEAAHQLSNFDPELQQAIIMNYGNVLGRYNQQKQHFDGIFGEYNPEEAFATGFSNYLNYPESMKAKYPEAYEFFDTLAKNQPEAVQYIKSTIEATKSALRSESEPTTQAKRRDSAFYADIDKKRGIASKWAPERQAEFLFRQGFLTEEEAVKAMEDGTAQEQIDRYFDVMEYNGDPTPTKPIRQSPSLYTEIQNGEHGGDWTQARKDYIRDWTGQSEEEVQETYRQLHTWFSNAWGRADTDCIDRYIDEDGACGREIFRGMHFSEEEYNAFMKNVVVGARIGMNGRNSSWTTDQEDAWNYSRNGDRHVIIRCKKNKTSAPVDHLSDKGESEVLAHSCTQWTVIGVQEGNGRTEIIVMEAEERMSKGERDRRKAQIDTAPEEGRYASLESRMNGQNRFISVTPPPEWLFKTHNAEDGGPGSGNFGHKGRPGKVGGSGPGGGKQYRGGRSDIGYFGSRKDWLNGLSGERQHEAARFIAGQKKAYQAKLDAKQKIEDLWAKGYLTRDEADERLKTAGLEDMPKYMRTEDYVMKHGSFKDRSQLVAFLHEARNWDEHADKLKQENLSEDERKLFDYMEKNFPTLDEDGMSAYVDLKAKAMGLPESGREVPDEIQYAAGTKERPAPPPPPEPQGPGLSWFDKPRNWKSNNLETYMELALGNQSPTWMHHYTKEEFADLNQRFLDKLKYGQLGIQEVRHAKGALVRLRNAMYPADPYAPRKSEEYHYTPESFKNLTEEEKARMVQIANAFSPSFTGISSVDEIDDNVITNIEAWISGSPMRKKDERQLAQDYILMQEKILGGFEPSPTNMLEAAAQKAQEGAAEKAAERQRTFEAEQKEFQNSPAAAKKKQAQQNIKALDVDSLRGDTPDATRSKIEQAMHDTGIFYGDKRFTTDPSIPPEAYIHSVKAYQRVVSEFPFLAGDLGGFGDEYKTSRAIAGTYKNAYKNGSEIIINYNLFKDPEKMNQSRAFSITDSKFKVPIDEGVSAVQATVTHELGHVLSNWLHRTAYGAFQEKSKKHGYYIEVEDVNQVAEEIKSKTMKAMHMRWTKDNITNNVSGYAFTDADEFFAECFCELMCSSNPRPVAVEFGKQIRKFIQDHGITDMTSASVPSALYQAIPYNA